MPIKNTQDYLLSLMKPEDIGRLSRFYNYSIAMYVIGVVICYVLITTFEKNISSQLINVFSLVDSLPRLKFDHNHLSEMAGLEAAIRIVAVEVAIILVALFCVAAVFYFSFSVVERDRSNSNAGSIFNRSVLSAFFYLICVSLFISTDFSLYQSDYHARFALPDNDFVILFVAAIFYVVVSASWYISGVFWSLVFGASK